MIKDNQKYFNRLHLLIDALIVAGSYMLSWYLKFEGPYADKTKGALEMGFYFSALYFLVPSYIVLYYMSKMYTPKRTQRIESEISNIIRANTMGAIAFMVALTAFKIQDFSRAVIVIFFFLNVALTILLRSLIRYVLRFFRKKGYNLKYIILVGYSRAAEEYINRINANPQWGYVIRGILDDKVPRGTTYRGVKILGTIENLNVILPVSHLDEIAVTLSLSDYNRLEAIVGLCEKSGVHTKFIPDYNSLIPNRPYTEDLMGLPVINIRYVPLTNTLNMVSKRLFDIAGSFFGIIILSPFLLVVAIIIKTTSKGPVIFRQERVGRHNKTFPMYKFRTMYVHAPEQEKKGVDSKRRSKSYESREIFQKNQY